MNSKRRFDSHVHTTYSPDGHDPMAAFAALVDEGVARRHRLCRALRLPADLRRLGVPRRGALSRRSGRVARARLCLLRRASRSITCYKVEGDIRRKLQQFPFDFVIGSIHTARSVDDLRSRNRPFLHDDAIFEQILTEYAAEFSASLAVPEFDVIGHPGVFQRHLDERFFSPASRGDRAHSANWRTISRRLFRAFGGN